MEIGGAGAATEGFHEPGDAALGGVDGGAGHGTGDAVDAKSGAAEDVGGEGAGAGAVLVVRTGLNVEETLDGDDLYARDGDEDQSRKLSLKKLFS